MAVAAVVIFFGMAPPEGPSDDAIRQVMAEDALNQPTAQGAPQQSVVNGWTARDLLEVIAKTGAASQDPRPAALLTLAVLGIALLLFTSGREYPVPPNGPPASTPNSVDPVSTPSGQAPDPGSPAVPVAAPTPTS